jgi:hypothetical protein
MAVAPALSLANTFYRIATGQCVGLRICCCKYRGARSRGLCMLLEGAHIRKVAARVVTGESKGKAASADTAAAEVRAVAGVAAAGGYNIAHNLCN